MLSPTPKMYDAFHCAACGMELECTSDCKCTDPAMVTLQCCGQDLQPGPYLAQPKPSGP
jgi:hypothetical protein